jgi:hypothetical protein
MDSPIQCLQHILRQGQRVATVIVIADHRNRHYCCHDEQNESQRKYHSQQTTFQSLSASLKIHIDVNQFLGMQGFAPPILHRFPHFFSQRYDD